MEIRLALVLIIVRHGVKMSYILASASCAHTFQLVRQLFWRDRASLHKDVERFFDIFDVLFHVHRQSTRNWPVQRCPFKKNLLSLMSFRFWKWGNSRTTYMNISMFKCPKDACLCNICLRFIPCKSNFLWNYCFVTAATWPVVVQEDKQTSNRRDRMQIIKIYCNTKMCMKWSIVFWRLGSGQMTSPS